MIKENIYIDARNKLRIMSTVNTLMQQISECVDPEFITYINNMIISGNFDHQELSKLENIVRTHELKQLENFVNHRV